MNDKMALLSRHKHDAEKQCVLGKMAGCPMCDVRYVESLILYE